MIALATTGDMAGVADIASLYFYKVKKLGEFRREVFCSTWNNLISTGAGLVIKRTSNGSGIVEGMGFLIYPDQFDQAPSAYAAFWYVSEESKGLAGGMLHLEVEAILKERGIARIYMTSLLNHRNGTVSKYLMKAGYQPIEVVYGKELT